MNILATVIKREVSVQSTRKNAPEWDSLKHIEIMFAIEDEFRLEFSEEDLGSLDSVVKIVEAILSRDAA